VRVQIAFDLAANGVGDWFTLDDPVMGVLGGTATTHPLAGDVLVDVTDDVRAVSVKRGRSRTLEKFTAGVATVTLDNRARAYDPTNAASAYYGSILPRKLVKIDVDGVYLYVGNVEDWNFAYTVSGDSTAETSCVDGMAYLASQVLAPGTATAQATGARVTAILDAVGWSDITRSISTGSATLDDDVRDDNVNALEYLQRVEVSEPGAFFISRDGMATFLDRSALQAFADTGVVFGGTGIPFMDIGVVYGTWSNGTAVGGTAVANDLVAQAAYGVMDASYTTLLSSASDAQALADWIVGHYAEPRYRVDSVTVRLEALSAARKAAILDLDLGDVTLVNWTPNNAGSAISQYVTIDGISHSARPMIHDVTFTMSETSAAFILDSATFGVLDTSSLGF
jgi:hypothetical protein